MAKDNIDLCARVARAVLEAAHNRKSAELTKPTQRNAASRCRRPQSAVRIPASLSPPGGPAEQVGGSGPLPRPIVTAECFEVKGRSHRLAVGAVEVRSRLRLCSLSKNSLLDLQIFRVSLRREFSCKPLNSLVDWELKSCKRAPNRQNSLLISLLAGNLIVETGSMPTASTTTQSDAKPMFPGL
jgi:hypothetical protein